MVKQKGVVIQILIYRGKENTAVCKLYVMVLLGLTLSACLRACA